jgi:sigma-70-like protein
MYESLQASADADWEKMRPVLDQVMHELKASDREAILLRYFENRPLADVGAKIGVSENAARMRVDRALEKLRSHLSRRGITTTAALSLVLSTHAIHTVPAGLAATLTSHSLADGTAGAGIVLPLLKIVAMKKMKFSIIVIIALFLMGTTAFVARRVWSKRQPTPPAITVQTPTAAELIAAESPEAMAPSILGVWRKNVAGKPYLDLQFDGKGGVSGTVVWYDGPRTDKVPIEIGTFDPKTGALRLEGETPGPDGAMLRYVIAGTLENDTLSGSFGIGSTKTGSFAFTK